MKQLIYLIYYVKSLDWQRFRAFLQVAVEETGESRFKILQDVIRCSFRYSTSLLDYFYFRFYQLKHEERATYAGTGFMYEFQLKMNPRGERDVLEDKLLFLHTYRPFVKRRFASRSNLDGDTSLARAFLNSPSGRVVLKGARGQVGAEVAVVQCDDFSESALIAFMRRRNYDLIEEFVVQHEDLMHLSPSGLNTLRVFTQLDQGNMILLGARLRITINSTIDNMAAGNPAAPVDLKTGRVVGPAVFSDIRKNAIDVHPVTGVQIVDFQIPYWSEILNMLEQVVRLAPKNKSVGWDIAITPCGPELIEGNHNWCKLLWQLPVGRGLKAELEKFS